MASSLFDVVPGESPDAAQKILLRVHLLTGAGRSEVAGTKENALVIRVASSPRSEHANEAVEKVVAELFGLESAAVKVVAGEQRPDKQLEITGLDGEAAGRILERARRGAGEGPAGRGRARAAR